MVPWLGYYITAWAAGPLQRFGLLETAPGPTTSQQELTKTTVLYNDSNSRPTLPALSTAASDKSTTAKQVTTPDDHEETGEAALKQCASSLAPNGPYETYEKNSEMICRHGNYITSYATDLMAPNWSAYKITPGEALEEHGGRRGFKFDPAVPEEHQEPLKSKCWGQKWNRGHLCPSYIMSYDKEANGPWDDTYFITNTAMQYGPFNQQTWQHLEIHTVNWIKEKKRELFIVTGTMFNRDALTKCDLSTGEIVPPPGAEGETTSLVTTGALEAVSRVASSSSTSTSTSGSRGIGQHGATAELLQQVEPQEGRSSFMGVPDYYYKIMCDVSAGKSIAHLGHNRDDDKVYEMSVDELQKKIGLKLFPAKACNTSVMASDYFWTEDLKNVNLVRISSSRTSEEKSTTTTTSTDDTAMTASRTAVVEKARRFLDRIRQVANGPTTAATAQRPASSGGVDTAAAPQEVFTF
ncbi:unnamed protein product [Amoebophrya sp. A25]|nr:unnamed protein product [Amoebophrya sp. A25]|eukprot:GSA25T00004485001.1